MDRVLFIPELLELILLQLDMATLLVSATRVSKTWKTVIDTSVSIQQTLYFKASLEPGTGYPTVNPLLKKRFGHCFFDSGDFYGYLRRANSFYSIPWTLSGGVGPRVRDPTEDRPAYPRGPQTSEMTTQQLLEIHIACEKFTRKEASWRKMLVSQPPPPCLGYLFMEADPVHFFGPHWVWTTLIYPNTGPSLPGLRMGTLYDIVQYRAGHHERNSMWFRVVWGEARDPYSTNSSRDKCRELLQQTNVVVEFYHISDEAFVEFHREPRDLTLFDMRFRSDDYQHVDVPINERTWKTGEEPALDGRYFIQ
ncbi:hypothetical protein GGR58DRAFT_500408 [Xylaria digitata]|nr:hypothetical protein GGR58DRAFT_500408 [Xylaria digitata]